VQSWPSPKEKVRIPVACPDISKRDIAFVARDLLKGNLSGTTHTISGLETLLEEHVTGSPTLVVSNGSVAIILALKGLGVGPGDEVLVPTLTYAATASSIVHVGAKPVFCDSEVSDWNVSLRELASKVTPRTKAVVLVDIYGITRDWRQVVSWARGNGLAVVHDCAESLSAKSLDLPSGYLADIRTYSFFANKVLTSGEGGALSTQDSNLFSYLRKLRGQGMSTEYRYWFEFPGFNFRLSSMQAAFLISQVYRLPRMLASRERLFRRYDAAFMNHGQRPKESPGTKFSPWLYTTKLNHMCPFELASRLANKGIETRPVFFPLHSMPAFANFVTPEENFDVANQISAQGISMPTWSRRNRQEEHFLFKTIEEILDVS
jgi:perosamine synthetase